MHHRIAAFIFACSSTALIASGSMYAASSRALSAEHVATIAHQPQPTPTPDAWYEPEIRAFEAADRASPPDPGQVLFIGSSSIRMWKSLAEDMAPAPVLKRGFGGSTTPDVLAVFDRIVRPYAPSIIVYYCGDNDLSGDKPDAEAAAEGFLSFERLAREAWPDVEVMYIAIKPSIARWRNWEAMRRANSIVRDHCEQTRGSTFLDIATPMLTPEGVPDPSLFLEDGLHLNEKGYAAWKAVIRPAVTDAWSRVQKRRDQ
ncbi:MAG: hypothetical protein KF838_05610 [Phycisphaeraceae bacterium]|nr:MAG: hypothetical protein KF838_05610 [Phycisphaeraceae bacterium]